MKFKLKFLALFFTYALGSTVFSSHVFASEAANPASSTSTTSTDAAGNPQAAPKKADTGFTQSPMAVAAGTESLSQRPDSDFLYVEINPSNSQLHAHFSAYLLKQLYPSIFNDSNSKFAGSSVKDVQLGLSYGDGKVLYTGPTGNLTFYDNAYKREQAVYIMPSHFDFDGLNEGVYLSSAENEVAGLIGQTVKIGLFVNKKLVRTFNVVLNSGAIELNESYGKVYQPPAGNTGFNAPAFGSYSPINNIGFGGNGFNAPAFASIPAAPTQFDLKSELTSARHGFLRGSLRPVLSAEAYEKLMRVAKRFQNVYGLDAGSRLIDFMIKCCTNEEGRRLCCFDLNNSVTNSKAFVELIPRGLLDLDLLRKFVDNTLVDNDFCGTQDGFLWSQINCGRVPAVNPAPVAANFNPAGGTPYAKFVDSLGSVLNGDEMQRLRRSLFGFNSLYGTGSDKKFIDYLLSRCVNDAGYWLCRFDSNSNVTNAAAYEQLIPVGGINIDKLKEFIGINLYSDMSDNVKEANLWKEIKKEMEKVPVAPVTWAKNELDSAMADLKKNLSAKAYGNVKKFVSVVAPLVGKVVADHVDAVFTAIASDNAESFVVDEDGALWPKELNWKAAEFFAKALGDAKIRRKILKRIRDKFNYEYGVDAEQALNNAFSHYSAPKTSFKLLSEKEAIEFSRDLDKGVATESNGNSKASKQSKNDKKNDEKSDDDFVDRLSKSKAVKAKLEKSKSRIVFVGESRDGSSRGKVFRTYKLKKGFLKKLGKLVSSDADESSSLRCLFGRVLESTRSDFSDKLKSTHKYAVFVLNKEGDIVYKESIDNFSEDAKFVDGAEEVVED